MFRELEIRRRLKALLVERGEMREGFYKPVASDAEEDFDDFDDYEFRGVEQLPPLGEGEDWFYLSGQSNA